MTDFNYNELHIEFLPTEERREYDQRLRKYVEYFQIQMESIENKSTKARILDTLNKEKKEKRLERIHSRMIKYGELVGKIVARTTEECMKKAERDFKQSPTSGTFRGMPIATVGAVVASAAAASNSALGTLGGGAVIAGGAGLLTDVSGLSDKQLLMYYKKAFETAMCLLQQSDVAEEKIKSALIATMNQIDAIKEKYCDIVDDDLLAQKIQDECVIEIIEGVEQTSDYDKFQKHIEQIIGVSAWNKMTQNAQIFLVTAELLYDQWKIYGEDIDFAPICMSISKALEVEVTRRYFIGYLNYLNRNNEALPDELLIKDGGSYREKTEEEFMLGNMTGVTGYVVYLDSETVKLVGRLTDENQKFLKYAKAELFVGKKESECVRLVKKHAYNVKKVCVQYRNPSAHKQKVTKVSARECLDYMIDVKKIMGEMLDDCSW